MKEGCLHLVLERMEEVLQPQLVNDHGVQLDKEPNSARQLHILNTRLGLDIALHGPPPASESSVKNYYLNISSIKFYYSL